MKRSGSHRQFDDRIEKVRLSLNIVMGFHGRWGLPGGRGRSGGHTTSGGGAATRGVGRQTRCLIAALLVLLSFISLPSTELARAIQAHSAIRLGGNCQPASSIGTAALAANAAGIHGPNATAVGCLKSYPDKIKVRLVRENLTLSLSLEDYCLGVLRAESTVEDRLEALKAQAIVSRTYALKNLGRHSGYGYDFCSLTHCQRYSPKKASPQSERLYQRAVSETAGQVLLNDRDNLIDAYFHAVCGGATANIGTLWGVTAPPYLQGVRDDYCKGMPNFRWTSIIPKEKLARALQTDPRTNAGPVVTQILVSVRDQSGRAETLTIEGDRTATIRGWDFKTIIGRNLGWNLVKSSWFDVSQSRDNFIFRGRGFGHGLGLCQEGAHVMAKEGSSFNQILAHYFPTTRVSRFSQ